MRYIKLLSGTIIDCYINIVCEMSSNEEDLDNANPSRGRERKRDENSWVKTCAKHARNTGKAYISRDTGKQVPARAVGPPCKDNCFDKIGPDKIKEIYDNFWSIANYDLQNAYLSKLVSSTDIKRSRVKDRPSRKLRRIKYTVISDNKVHVVCRTALYHIHGITEGRVRSVLAKQTPTGGITPDQRGQHGTCMVSQERRQSAIDHIASVPKLSSHHSRAKSPYRKYLATGLNVTKM